MISRLGWVTTRDARGLDDDEPIALEALADTGVAVEVVDWDNPHVRWSQFDRVVLRSTWDYPERLPEFLSWLESVAVVTNLVNPAATVKWNLDKQYLAELHGADIPITPTSFVPPGDSPFFPDGDFVVKPAVGAGSRDAAGYGADQRHLAAEHIARLHLSGTTALVQPYISSVATDGEWPLVFFGGRFSHAASKRVALPRAGDVGGLFATEISAGHTATRAQIDVAQNAVDLISTLLGTPSYARVDLVRDDAGSFCVLEAELIEPSLFLAQADPAAAARFAAILVG